MKKLYFVLFFIQGLLLSAQNPADIDPTFGLYSGFNGAVKTICLQSDSKILVGGYFNSYQGQTQNFLIRLNPDGTIDNSFDMGKGFTYSVLSICVQPDGKILVGGDFTSYQEQTIKSLIRLNPDGSIDSSFSTDKSFNASISEICLQPNGKILIGGNFITYDGQSQNRIIRLNSDGTKDNSFEVGTGFNGQINVICIQPDGKILTGGIFSNYQGKSKSNVARLNIDGTIDELFNIGTGFNDSVESIFVQPDGKIVLGGAFITYQEQDQNYLIRLNPDGTKDNSFNIGKTFSWPISTICQQPDGKILVGGMFTKYQGQTQMCLIRLNPDGTKDNSFNIKTGVNKPVFVICLQSNEKILVGGYFTTYQDKPFSCLIRLNGDSKLSTEKFETGNTFTLYPNPVKDKITLSSTDTSKIESLEVYDLLGKMILKSENIDNTMNVSHLNSGIYLLKTYTNGKSETHKFVKD